MISNVPVITHHSQPTFSAGVFYGSFFSKLCLCLRAAILRLRNQLRYRLSCKVAYGSARTRTSCAEALADRGALECSKCHCPPWGAWGADGVWHKICFITIHFHLRLSSRERLRRLWLLKETKTAFVLLIESMVFSEQKCRSETNYPFPTACLRLETTPNCHRKELGFMWKCMNQLLKIKLEALCVAATFIPGK